VAAATTPEKDLGCARDRSPRKLARGRRAASAGVVGCRDDLAKALDVLWILQIDARHAKVQLDPGESAARRAAAQLFERMFRQRIEAAERTSLSGNLATCSAVQSFSARTFATPPACGFFGESKK
jgi:hypothetical protein